MTRRGLVAASGALTLAAMGLAGTATAATEPPTAVGWWTRTPGARAAPEGGFEVASLGGQPGSVAALRFASTSGATATLTLTEQEAATTPATVLLVCTTTDPWEPANPGAYGDAPTADCTSAVDLTRDDEGSTWSAEVGPLLGAGSLMVVAGESAGGGSPVDPGFRIIFSGASLDVVAAPSPASSPAFSEPSGGGSDSFSSPSSPPPASSSPGTGFSGGGGSFQPPASEIPDASTTVTTVAVDDTEEGSGDGAGDEAFAAPELAAGASSARTEGKPWSRLLFLVPLSAIIGVASVQARKLLEARGVVDT